MEQVHLLSFFCTDIWEAEFQDPVTVVGYPIGGDTISVTSGVVSRIEVKRFFFSNTTLFSLLVCSIEG
jgi:hypothetical protein